MTVTMPEENMVAPNARPYDYQTALRNRLAQINEMGAQQNAYVQQKAAADQAKQLEAQRQQMLQAMASRQNQSVGTNSDGSIAGGFGNGGVAKNPNPRSVTQALEYAKQAAANGDSNWYRMCLAFVANAYGLKASGIPTAIAAWEGATNRHRDMNPATGSLVFWDTGRGRAGHVALYAGNGMIYSNDITGAGRIGYVPIGDISKKWGSTYLGWTDPYFATSPRR
jgi:hypothetical protein